MAIVMEKHQAVRSFGPRLLLETEKQDSPGTS